VSWTNPCFYITREGHTSRSNITDIVFLAISGPELFNHERRFIQILHEYVWPLDGVSWRNPVFLRHTWRSQVKVKHYWYSFFAVSGPEPFNHERFFIQILHEYVWPLDGVSWTNPESLRHTWRSQVKVKHHRYRIFVRFRSRTFNRKRYCIQILHEYVWPLDDVSWKTPVFLRRTWRSRVKVKHHRYSFVSFPVQNFFTVRGIAFKSCPSMYDH
jgi:hypothetical protein